MTVKNKLNSMQTQIFIYGFNLFFTQVAFLPPFGISW